MPDLNDEERGNTISATRQQLNIRIQTDLFEKKSKLRTPPMLAGKRGKITPLFINTGDSALYFFLFLNILTTPYEEAAV